MSGDFCLTLDQDRILQLLMGENLYDNRDVFVRELLQNAAAEPYSTLGARVSSKSSKSARRSRRAQTAVHLTEVRKVFPNYTLHDGTHVLNVLDASYFYKILSYLFERIKQS